MNGPSAPGRYARLLRILGQLQSGGGLNASQFAGRLDVSRRTIFRDLNVMRDAGIALFFDDDMECYRLTPQDNLLVNPTLDPDELLTLVAAVHLSVLRDLPDCKAQLQQSTKKLLASSSFDVRHSVTRLTNSCTVRTPSDDYPPRAIRVVHHILQAIQLRRKLRITLADPDSGESVDTRLAPYRMVATSDSWQVTGRSSHHHGVRTFDPRYIHQADITNEIYAVPRGFQSRG